MTALVEAEEGFPLRVGTLSILAVFQGFNAGFQVRYGECEVIGEFGLVIFSFKIFEVDR